MKQWLRFMCPFQRIFQSWDRFIGKHLLKLFNLRICQKDATLENCDIPLVFSEVIPPAIPEVFSFLRKFWPREWWHVSLTVVNSPCNCAIANCYSLADCSQISIMQNQIHHILIAFLFQEYPSGTNGRQNGGPRQGGGGKANGTAPTVNNTNSTTTPAYRSEMR